jgi:hypothetical protein
MIRARTIGTVAGTAGTLVAAAALAAWLLGRVASDRYAWSQWLLWIPTPAMLPVVLLGLAAALRPTRDPRRRTRRLATWGVLGAALALYFLAIEHRFLRFGGRDRTGLSILHSSIYPGRVKGQDPYVDRLIAAGADVIVLSNQVGALEAQRLAEALGGSVTIRSLPPFMVISRPPIVQFRPLVVNGEIRITLFRLDAVPKLGRELTLYVVDLPSDPKLPRHEMALAVRRMLDGVEAPPPDIVVGDFNMTHGSASLAALFPGLTHAYAQAGRGYGATFPRALPLYHLDHALLSDPFMAADYELIDLGTGRHLAQRVVVTAR